MTSPASRRHLNEAINALNRFARSRKLNALHTERAGIDLNFAAFDVLDKLVEHGPMPASRLADLTHMAPNALSRQLRLLEDAGHISRQLDPLDARVSIIDTTGQGLDAHHRFHQANDDMLTRQLRHWTADELDDLAATILRLVADLRNTDLR